MGPLLSAFCDGEASSDDAAMLREHLHACASCRATLRAYRAAPGAAAALAPTLPLTRSLLDRAHDAFAGLTARFGGGGAGSDSALSQVAASGGARGAGMAALAKVAAICVGTAGGAVACVATGMVPAPLDIDHQQTKTAVVERKLDPVLAAEWDEESGVDYETAAPPAAPAPDPTRPPTPARHEPLPVAEPVSTPATETSGGATEYAPEPAPVAAPETVSASSSSSGRRRCRPESSRREACSPQPPRPAGDGRSLAATASPTARLGEQPRRAAASGQSASHRQRRAPGTQRTTSGSGWDRPPVTTGFPITGGRLPRPRHRRQRALGNPHLRRRRPRPSMIVVPRQLPGLYAVDLWLRAPGGERGPR